MATKTSKAAVRAKLLAMRDMVDGLLGDVCPACPKCCPGGEPKFPCVPGEIIVSVGQIGMCSKCWGRGYIVPEESERE